MTPPSKWSVADTERGGNGFGIAHVTQCVETQLFAMVDCSRCDLSFTTQNLHGFKRFALVFRLLLSQNYGNMYCYVSGKRLTSRYSKRLRETLDITYCCDFAMTGSIGASKVNPNELFTHDGFERTHKAKLLFWFNRFVFSN